MRKIGMLMTITTGILIALNVIFGVKSDYEYNRDIGSYWSLSDKASTVEKKSEYLDLYVKALEKSDLLGSHNAIILKTPDNLFDNNLIALRSLQQRMHDIVKMDVGSFEYQTAMQQITGQEQGEADEMVSLFRSVWYKNNYFLLWNWIAYIQITLLLVLCTLGIMFWIN